jgi:hypothetical protein
MKLFAMTLFFVATISFLGCGSSEAPSPSSHTDHEGHVDGDEHADHDEHGHDEHGHPSEGPHHGSLIELGNEEYHAELVHDEVAGTVTVYLLDSSAKTSVPIYETKVLVNLTHDGSAEQFELAASPQSTDPSGKSSRFVSTDAELAEDLDLEDVEAKLVITIGGKQYRGDIEHDHDHEGADGHDH